ncbi:cyanate permease [Phyllobacterium sp. 1468]|nr:cyanate permease [Phyllobacterium sp. 1468]
MASGPVIAGYLHDWTGGYAASLIVIGVLAVMHFFSHLLLFLLDNDRWLPASQDQVFSDAFAHSQMATSC